MFFEEGWVPLSEATAEVFRRLQALKAAGGIGEGQGSLKLILAISVWDICDASTKVGVTAADGTVIAASKDLVAWADPRELFNEHLSLQAGSVGSSPISDAEDKAPSEAELKARYGPFLNLPVVIPVNNFQSSMTFLAEEVSGNPSKDEEIVNGARTILKMVDGGELVTREIARTALGATMSRRKFKLAWAIAAQHRDHLSAPNRWLGM
ncbi:MAG: hypothetical protein QNJ16_12825 [Rhodobacter sp.]|nr:hypothetical protein [Rhodobacter sp.]